MSIKPFYTYLLLFAVILILIMSILKVTNPEGMLGESGTGNRADKPSSMDFNEKYFERWHAPYGSSLEPEMLEMIWKEIRSVPVEPQDGSTEEWRLLGPYGSKTTTNVFWSGRILDIHLYSDGEMKVGASSGGLWASADSLPVPIGDGITSPEVSTFDIQPGNENIIVAGTGQTVSIAGTGIWRTSNGGTNWANIVLTPQPRFCYKIRFTPGSQSVVHAATDVGYFRSTDAGISWTRILDNDVTDVAVNWTDPSLMYLGRRDNPHFGGIGGVFKSTNGGLNWTKLENVGLPGSNIGNTVVSICSDLPQAVYCLIAKDNPWNEVLGVFKTMNGGNNWTSVSPPEDILGGGGTSSTGVIGVCPGSSQIVLAGGLWLWRTVNGGTSWDKITDRDEPSIHADIHSIAWDSAGNSVCVGHDGGTSFSPHREAYYFTSEKNRWAVTEYYGFDVGQSNNMIIFGGSQDNAFTGTTDGGITWKYTIVGAADGGGIAVDPLNAANIYGSLGAYGGGLLFRREQSTNFGQNWSVINGGLGNGSDWAPMVRAGNLAPIFVYTYSGSYFYVLSGSTWTQMNASPFTQEIGNFSVRDYGTNHTTVIYLAFNSTNPNERLKVKVENGPFVERSLGFPDSVTVRSVALHPTNENIAIALMNGFYAGRKVFITTNQGLNWSNISGNLPNIPMGDLVIHPEYPGVYYLGTEMGCFKTVNGGSLWFRWNDGMAETAIVTEMKSYTSGNDFYVVAGTYGRGIWKRREDIPVGIVNNSGVPGKFILHQNYPNPFNQFTIINYQLSIASDIRLNVYDVTGREVAVLVNKEMKPGKYEIRFDASNLASGVYFYKMTASEFSDVKRMILVK